MWSVSFLSNLLGECVSVSSDEAKNWIQRHIWFKSLFTASFICLTQLTRYMWAPLQAERLWATPLFHCLITVSKCIWMHCSLQLEASVLIAAVKVYERLLSGLTDQICSSLWWLTELSGRFQDWSSVSVAGLNVSESHQNKLCRTVFFFLSLSELNIPVPFGACNGLPRAAFVHIFTQLDNKAPHNPITFIYY